jgi:UDP-N-acetyl-D-mannosaminuronate dehydrogenase
MTLIATTLTYKKTVSILGMGLVGLPTACILAKVGYKVVGVFSLI